MQREEVLYSMGECSGWSLVLPYAFASMNNSILNGSMSSLLEAMKNFYAQIQLWGLNEYNSIAYKIGLFGPSTVFA